MPANANSVANGGDINKPAAPGRNINDDDLVPSTRMDSTDMLDNANSSLSTMQSLILMRCNDYY